MPNFKHTADPLDALRAQLKSARQSMTPEIQAQAARQVADLICNSPLFQQAKRLAVYHPQKGELDPMSLAAHAWQTGKQVFLPVVYGTKLIFRQYLPDSILIPERYGIYVPQQGFELPAEQLDIVFMPLVGFDPHTGHRLGMGGGYYDRTFAERTAEIGRPRLVGLAHTCQACTLAPQTWDVAMDAVCTPEYLRFFA
ncbi:MAG: 5-formyltetrahydrofolate cyclo-ligase [Pseudomonadota bacterium]